MTRRQLLAALFAAPAVAAIDPERLLWTPGARLISIPRLRYIVKFGIGDIVSFDVCGRPLVNGRYYDEYILKFAP